MKSSMILRSIGGKSKMKMGKFLRILRSGCHVSSSSALIHFYFLFYRRSVGYIPSNYVKEKETIGLQKYE